MIFSYNLMEMIFIISRSSQNFNKKFKSKVSLVKISYIYIYLSIKILEDYEKNRPFNHRNKPHWKKLEDGVIARIEPSPPNLTILRSIWCINNVSNKKQILNLSQINLRNIDIF